MEHWAVLLAVLVAVLVVVLVVVLAAVLVAVLAAVVAEVFVFEEAVKNHYVLCETNPPFYLLKSTCPQNCSDNALVFVRGGSGKSVYSHTTGRHLLRKNPLSARAVWGKIILKTYENQLKSVLGT